MNDVVINSLITAGLPALVTLITFFSTNRSAKMHAAKQSILQMIMEDKVAWLIDKDFPTNYGRVLDEYEIYHKNGGNGEVTKKVNEYKKWYEEVENSLKQK